jgi:protein-disulfide isomerase
MGKTGLRRQAMAVAVLFLTAGLLPLTAPAAGQEAQPVATVDGVAVSAQELANAAATQLLPLRSQEIQVQTRALEKLIRQKLVESAAQKKGESSDVYLAEEVDRKLPLPGDAEVLAYYLAQPERGRQPLADVKEQLRETLRRAQVQYARAAYLDGLRAQADVAILFNPLRSTVTYDAARMKGDPKAPVVLVEFADFQCPYCRREEPILKNLLAKYGVKVVLAYRDFPVAQLHPLAEQAAEASHCAGEQGAYWPMHELLMTGSLEPAGLKQDAQQLKLDEKQLASCLATGKYKATVENDRQEADRAGITATPTFFINGITIVGAETEENLSRVIDEELARQAAASARH